MKVWRGKPPGRARGRHIFGCSTVKSAGKSGKVGAAWHEMIIHQGGVPRGSGSELCAEELFWSFCCWWLQDAAARSVMIGGHQVTHRGRCSPMPESFTRDSVAAEQAGDLAVVESEQVERRVQAKTVDGLWRNLTHLGFGVDGNPQRTEREHRDVVGAVTDGNHS